MTPDQTQLLRRLALNDTEAVKEVMSGRWEEHNSVNPRLDALVRIVALLCVDSDPGAFQWASDTALAVGLEDVDIFRAIVVVAPIIGSARLSSALPHLMDALGLHIIDDHPAEPRS